MRFRQCAISCIVHFDKKHAEHSYSGMGSNRVTVTKFLQLPVILELYLEHIYLMSQISLMMVTVTEVTEIPKFLI